ncbi:unnamed protein product [Amoebophrya sp. A25]|nr:unnamed protein product [Amoebophrya sp. A25]|eukprot:GSA25T00011599001.1
MGCHASKPPVAEQRRRLSLGFVDPVQLNPTKEPGGNQRSTSEFSSQSLEEILEQRHGNGGNSRGPSEIFNEGEHHGAAPVPLSRVSGTSSVSGVSATLSTASSKENAKDHPKAANVSYRSAAQQLAASGTGTNNSATPDAQKQENASTRSSRSQTAGSTTAGSSTVSQRGGGQGGGPSSDIGGKNQQMSASGGGGKPKPGETAASSSSSSNGGASSHKNIWIAGSQTDVERHRRQSFTQKTILKSGDGEKMWREGLGFVCKKGLKPEAPNQDSFLIVKTGDDVSLYAVFDGHGPCGHDVSEFVKNELPKVLFTDPSLLSKPGDALKNAFQRTQRLLERANEVGHVNAQFSGTTVTVAIHLHLQDELWIAHVGDSRAVVGRRGQVEDTASARGEGGGAAARKTQTAKVDYLATQGSSQGLQLVAPGGQTNDTGPGRGGKNELFAVDLTHDHKPDDPLERERIESSGGRVIFDGFYNYRVYARSGKYPGLNMSRALGDLAGYYDAGISATPTITYYKLSGTAATGGKMDHEVGLMGQPAAINGQQQIPGAILPTTSASEPGHRGHVDVFCDGGVLGSDEFLLVCSDGVWEFMSSQECVEMVDTYIRNVGECAEIVAKECWDRWSRRMLGQVVDDITAVIVKL